MIAFWGLVWLLATRVYSAIGYLFHWKPGSGGNGAGASSPEAALIVAARPRDDTGVNDLSRVLDDLRPARLCPEALRERGRPTSTTSGPCGDSCQVASLQPCAGGNVSRWSKTGES